MMERIDIENPVDVIIPYSPDFTPARMLDQAVESAEAQEVETEIRIVKDESNRGPAWARNQGLERSENRFVAFLDADDIWKSGKLQKQLALMTDADVGLCIRWPSDSKHGPSLSPKLISQSLLSGDVGSLTSSILVDTQLVGTRFREDLPRLEDVLFIIESAAEAGAVGCPGNLVKIQKHDQGLSEASSPEDIFVSRMKTASFIQQSLGLDTLSKEVRRQAYYSRGRAYQVRGQALHSVMSFARSLSYGISGKTMIALLMTPVYSLSNILSNP